MSGISDTEDIFRSENVRSKFGKKYLCAQAEIYIFHFLQGYIVDYLGTTSSPWRVTAILQVGAGGHPNAALTGSTEVTFQDGWANFTDLTISHPGHNYTILFNVSLPETVSFQQVSKIPSS